MRKTPTNAAIYCSLCVRSNFFTLLIDSDPNVWPGKNVEGGREEGGEGEGGREGEGREEGLQSERWARGRAERGKCFNFTT